MAGTEVREEGDAGAGVHEGAAGFGTAWIIGRCGRFLVEGGGLAEFELRGLVQFSIVYVVVKGLKLVP